MVCGENAPRPESLKTIKTGSKLRGGYGTLAMSTSANFTRFMPWLATYPAILLLSYIGLHIVGHSVWDPLLV